MPRRTDQRTRTNGQHDFKGSGREVVLFTKSILHKHLQNEVQVEEITSSTVDEVIARSKTKLRRGSVRRLVQAELLRKQQRALRRANPAQRAQTTPKTGGANGIDVPLSMIANRGEDDAPGAKANTSVTPYTLGASGQVEIQEAPTARKTKVHDIYHFDGSLYKGSEDGGIDIAASATHSPRYRSLINANSSSQIASRQVLQISKVSESQSMVTLSQGETHSSSSGSARTEPARHMNVDYQRDAFSNAYSVDHRQTEAEDISAESDTVVLYRPLPQKSDCIPAMKQARSDKDAGRKNAPKGEQTRPQSQALVVLTQSKRTREDGSPPTGEPQGFLDLRHSDGSEGKMDVDGRFAVNNHGSKPSSEDDDSDSTESKEMTTILTRAVVPVGVNSRPGRAALTGIKKTRTRIQGRIDIHHMSTDLNTEEPLRASNLAKKTGHSGASEDDGEMEIDNEGEVIAGTVEESSSEDNRQYPVEGNTSSESDDQDAGTESDDSNSSRRVKVNRQIGPPTHRRSSHSPTLNGGAQSNSQHDQILLRISKQLEELGECQKGLSTAVEKLQEKVGSLEQQSIAARAANVEHSSPPRTRRSATRAGRFVIPKPKTRRGDDRNEILVATIRQSMNRKLGIRRDRDIISLDLSGFPSRRTAKHYIDQRSQPPEAQLPVCWEDLRCSWNDLLSQSFLASFVKDNPQYEGRDDEILDHFWRRLERLKSLRRRTSRREGETEDQCVSRRQKILADEQRRLRKRSRQDQLFVDRRRVASQNANHHAILDQRKQWASVMTIIERLGVAGMSSDESEDLDGDTRERRYTVRARVWRSRKIQDLLVRTDQELRQTKKSLYGNAPPGNPPRVRHRVKTPASSKRTAVGRLPVNYYDKEWLRTLPDVARGQLSPGERLELPKLPSKSRSS